MDTRSAAAAGAAVGIILGAALARASGYVLMSNSDRESTGKYSESNVSTNRRIKRSPTREPPPVDKSNAGNDERISRSPPAPAFILRAQSGVGYAAIRRRERKLAAGDPGIREVFRLLSSFCQYNLAASRAEPVVTWEAWARALVPGDNSSDSDGCNSSNYGEVKANDSHTLGGRQEDRRLVKIDMEASELRRVWNELSRTSDGEPREALTEQEFVEGVRRMPLARSIIEQFPTAQVWKFTVAADYDYCKSTNENYEGEAGDFIGEFADIRATLDYSYHVNYSKPRQQWQDLLIRSFTIRTEPQPQPWCVYTCGPMGAGKGYVIRWMSENGFFPLENIVRVDPDLFKSHMPEWRGYIQSNPKQAGTLCHRESGFIQEIAQEAAMRKAQNVWIDGSLRDGEWFKKQFIKLRRRHPLYRLAIFVITASEATVRERVATRERETGRAVPEDSIVASLKSVAFSLNVLTPLVDFVARIDNEIEPTLLSFESIDRRGDWGAIRSEFALTHHGSSWFPIALPPLILRPVPLVQTSSDRLRQSLSDITDRTRKNLIRTRLTPFEDAMSPELRRAVGDLTLLISPASPVNLNLDARRRAGVPFDARSFVFVYPSHTLSEDVMKQLLRGSFAGTAASFVLVGGYVYFSESSEVVAINAAEGVGCEGLCDTSDLMLLQFRSPVQLTTTATRQLIEQYRFRPVTLASLLVKGARYFAWIGPGEQFDDLEPNVAPNGGFAYLFHDLDTKARHEDPDLLFPVAMQSAR